MAAFAATPFAGAATDGSLDKPHTPGLSRAASTQTASAPGETVVAADYRVWSATLDRSRVDDLPAFELADLDGHLWNRDELRDKAVMIYAWGADCAPCLRDLSEVERLSQLFAGNDRVLVLTLNVDRDPQRVRRLMEERGWDFPVLQGADLFAATDASFAVPETWFLEPVGTARFRDVGRLRERALIVGPLTRLAALQVPWDRAADHGRRQVP